ncbi:MAG: type II toxin-antitoxin system RelE/ParE family toxin [Candidatus Hydrogenedentes bacterium]|nr:type II toxin-antitoxin system RelE/ParE family toxin [Candidatus Hydrogenedentota bacterium]
MNLRLLSPAQVELAEAISWYEGQEPGLGAAFLDEVERTLDDIAASPTAYARVCDHIRRALVHRFPYSIFYEVLPDATVVYAICHWRRQPEYWRDRR